MGVGVESPLRSMSRSGSTRGQRAGLAVLLAAGVALLGALPAFAAGSHNLFPSGAGGSRANTEWRTSTYGGGQVYRRTLIHAYATAGEHLLMGSTGVGVGSADILVWDPGLVTGSSGLETVPGSASFSCAAQRTASSIAAQGEISSRAQELAGPDTVPAGGVTNGYTPCFYQAPATGVYSIAMLGPSGLLTDAGATPGADVGLTGAADFDASQAGSVAAWDVTVRDDLADAATTKTGRVFAYALALFTGGNGLPVDSTTYPVTLDGYRYQTDDRGMDPNGWVQYGNQLGFLDPDGQTPLYHDALAAPGASNPAQLTTIQGGVLFATPQYPIFLEPPSSTALTGLGIPLTATAPSVSNVSFTGSQSGNTSFFQTGGMFHFTTNLSGVHEIIISRDGVDFDPTSAQNRVIRGADSVGAQSIAWNGKDNAGTYFPPGATYQFRIRMHAGEYHFPFIDVENSTQGGPTITLLNPPGAVCPPQTGGCTSGFYDDRGYTTTTGATVGTPGSVLCGNAPPATAFSDPVNGFDTSGAQRTFGTVTGGNTNVPCTGSFGDTKGLDLWTYYPSQSANGQLQIVDDGDIAVTNNVNNATPAVGTNVTFTITATNNGPSDATGVAVTNNLSPGLTYVTSSTAAGSFDPTTGVWTIGPIASGGTVTLTVTATVTTAGSQSDTATKTAEDQADSNSANDSATTSVNGQAADIGVTNVVSNPAPDVGATVTFTVTATNHGPDDATGVQLTDQLPPGLTFVSASPSAGTYDPSTGLWTIGAVADGASATLTITATVTQAGTLTDTATRTASSPPDANAANDSASASVDGQSADLQVTLHAPSSFTSGGTGDYVVDVANNGPSPAAGPIVVIDTLPPGLQFVGGSGSGWTCSASGQTVTCTTTGPLPNGATEPPLTITVKVTATPGDHLSDTVTVSSSTPDPLLSNNTATALTPVVDPPSVPNTGMNAAGRLALHGMTLIFAGMSLLVVSRRRRRSSLPR